MPGRSGVSGSSDFNSLLAEMATAHLPTGAHDEPRIQCDGGPSSTGRLSLHPSVELFGRCSRTPKAPSDSMRYGDVPSLWVWPEDRIIVIDHDQGQSGASTVERGLSAIGRRRGFGKGGHRDGLGSIAVGPELRRLASASGDLWADRDLDPRRGWAVRPRALQRPTSARPQGHDERSRVACTKGTVGGRRTEQGATRRVEDATADRVELR